MIEFLGVALICAAIIYWHAPIIASVVMLWFFVVHLSWLRWILAHPWQTIMYVTGYFLIGAGWSVVKWWFAETNRVAKAKERWLEQEAAIRSDTKAVSYSKSKTWIEYAKTAKTDPTSYKSDIKIWISCWPFSAAWTLLDDPIRRIARRIYRELQAVYQRITDSVWK